MKNFPAKGCFLILVLLLLSNILVSQAQPVRGSRIESSVSKVGAERWRVSLSPRDRWFDTGINVVAGTMIHISATGRITWAPPGGRDMSPTVGPNGTRPPFEEDKARFPMPKAGCGSLIMRVANLIYPVGESGSIQVEDSGTIQLMVNDDVLSDNSGSFSIDVEIAYSGRDSDKQANNLLFSSQRDGNQEIYSLDLATRRVTNLTQIGADDGYPRCSPDGQRIAFATNRDGYWEIYLMNRDGSGQRNLTKNREGSGYMDWSPDGQSLVFASTRYRNRLNDIYTIQGDGSNLIRLTNHPAEDVHPVWSPDGRKIAFASERDGNRQIYVMNADGSALQRLTNNRGYDDYPAWSPNGSQIAFASDRDSGSSDRLDIYVMNANGTNTRRVVGHPADDRHPAWSPDGKMLAFASNRDGDRDIFIINADGTNLRKVVSAPGDDEHPHWCGVTSTMPEESSKPIEEMEIAKWEVLTAGLDTPSDFQFTSNHRLLYRGRPITGLYFDSSVETVQVTSLSPDGKYALCVTIKDEMSQCFLLRLNSYTGVRLKLNGTPLLWASWSPSGNYAVIGSYIQDNITFYALQIPLARAIQIPLSPNIKNLEGLPIKEGNFNLNRVKWLSPQLFSLPASVSCSPSDNPRCTEDYPAKLLRSYDVQVNVGSLEVTATKTVHDLDSISAINFRNLRYQSGDDISIAIFNGYYGDGGNSYPGAKFVDFDNDGKDEAVFVMQAHYSQTASGPGVTPEDIEGYSSTIIVFAYRNGHLQHIFYKECDLSRTRIVGRSLVITQVVRKEKVKRNGVIIEMPTLYETSVYNWRNGRLILDSSKRHTTIEM